MALNLCIILPFCVALLLSSRSWFSKVFWTAAAAVALLTIVSTYSRGGFLTMVAVLLMMWRRFSISARTAIFLLAVLVALPTAAILVVGKSSYLERLSTVITPQADASVQARQALLTKSLEVTVRHPIFGVGPGQFVEVSGNWHLTHNTYTEISSEAGIPALLIFLMLIRRAFRNLRASRITPERTQAWYLAGALYSSIVGYLVGAFFLSTAYLLVPYLLVSYSSAFRRILEVSDSPIGEPLTTKRVLA